MLRLAHIDPKVEGLMAQLRHDVQRRSRSGTSGSGGSTPRHNTLPLCALRRPSASLSGVSRGPSLVVRRAVWGGGGGPPPASGARLPPPPPPPPPPPAPRLSPAPSLT